MKHLVAKAEAAAMKALAAAGGLRQPEQRIAEDAQAYWSDAGSKRHSSNSHWRWSEPFRGNDLWHQLGQKHVEMFERSARAVGFDKWGRLLDWGVGGGMNAAAFASRFDEIVGVDIADETLAQAGRELAEVSFEPVRIDVTNPEAVLGEIKPVDAFICLYVFELIPTPEYGARLLEIARELLNPGGLALVQIKYSDGRLSTRPRYRNYRRGVADMTTYSIPEFWQLAERHQLHPVSVELVPKDPLDERYAYFTLRR